MPPPLPEALDIEDAPALLAYLRRTSRIAPAEQPRIAILQGGVSNRTVRVERASGEAWVLKQALAKLRVPVDWFSSPERIHREALGLEWLARLARPGSITPLLFEDRGQYLLAMQAVPQPHENWKTMLLRGDICADHVRQFAELLAAVHRDAYGRADLAAVFGDRSFFESLRLEPYYGYSAQQAPAAAAFLNALIRETLACRITLVHGDYSPKNILVHEGRLVLLDHEVIHFGDPAFDLGFSLTHFLSKAHHLPARRHDFAAAALAYWRVYAEELGKPAWAADLEPRAVRHTLACLLARVVGRSPLEYLDAAERIRQRDAVLHILHAVPVTVADLISQFEKQLCL
ncbi:MAG TPA: phosphotransferase [Bryobacteraceae bacterium]|nr:phosphotransferase [Bryobacteraceae bacterium]